MAKLVLFDLDQTLINLIHLYDRAFHETFVEVYGINGHLRDVDFAGNTVAEIMLDVCEKHGIPRRVAGKKLKRALGVLQQFFLADLRLEGKVKPLAGVGRFLAALKKEGAVLGITTGAPKSAAMAILKKAGLLDFSVFATGERGGDKVSLARTAKQRVEKKLGKKFPWREVVVVGDSLREVEAAKKLGARSIAVATGFHSRARLKRAGADFVFGDFSDYAKAAAAVLS